MTAPWPGRSWRSVRANRATVNAVRIRMIASMRISDLDFDDLSDPKKANQLHRYCNTNQEFPHRVGEQNRHVLAINSVQDRKDNDGQSGQQITGHPPLRGVNPDLPADG